QENIQEHSLQVAMIAHALAVIRNKFYDGKLDPDRIAVIALYHDISEVVTGDLPSPIKYFNPDIRDAYKQIEARAEGQIISLLPEGLYDEYHQLILEDGKRADYKQVISAADKLSAYIKCLEEINAGNMEFSKAKKAIWESIVKMDLPEVDYFIKHFIPSFELTLDELNFPKEKE
ncbi:MAG: 5'-deoxynucleotidase, partial [Anaerolineales bacterium]